MTDLPKCPTCGIAPEIKIRSRGMNWGSAQIRCVGHHHIGFSFPPGGEERAKRDLFEKWKKLVEENHEK
ncbi:hypothetical protein [Lelliottia wanjuensis]|nr:hypothetical protein [Lelliottia sp. V106_9]MDK9617125.1 hypothetical protein [Lelliottia sp. V106_9]